jgi:hypothetical protein
MLITMPTATKMCTIAVFMVCLGMGLWLAGNRPLWNDEVYSQANLTKYSYGDIALGRVDEGNNSPLFYTLQKVLCHLTGYETPAAWLHGDRSFDDPYSRFFLRLHPIILVSLSIAIIFYYFSTRYSLWVGIYSFFVSISSFMVWSFWAESRPYALLFILSTLQSLFLIELFRKKENDTRLWNALVITHVLLCLTAVFSGVQVIAISVVLWILVERRWQKYIWMLALPLGLSAFYRYMAPKYLFWFKENPVHLVFANIPTDRLAIICAAGIYLAICWLRKDGVAKSKEVYGYFLSTIAMITGCVLIIGLFLIKETPPTDGFQISNRYFMCLTPFGIIATTLFSVYLIRACHHKIVKSCVICSFIFLLALRLWRTYELNQHFFR